MLPEKSIGGVGGVVVTTATGRYIMGYDLVMDSFNQARKPALVGLRGKGIYLQHMGQLVEPKGGIRGQGLPL